MVVWVQELPMCRKVVGLDVGKVSSLVGEGDRGQGVGEVGHYSHCHYWTWPVRGF